MENIGNVTEKEYALRNFCCDWFKLPTLKDLFHVENRTRITLVMKERLLFLNLDPSTIQMVYTYLGSMYVCTRKNSYPSQ